ncbi:MAG: hypothetical protein C9356_09800 [Oleiphilus sp.]|nr:MAG: hypothetical protein C9356_09800 [Oleiphilus sp.]
MIDKRQTQKRYALLLLLSLLIHLGAYMGYLLGRVPMELPAPEQRVVVQLSLPSDPVIETIPEPAREQTPKEPLPEEPMPEEQRQEDVPKEETHAPVDNSDRFASDNQEDRSATEIVARERRTEPAVKPLAPTIPQSESSKEVPEKTALSDASAERPASDGVEPLASEKNIVAGDKSTAEDGSGPDTIREVLSSISGNRLLQRAAEDSGIDEEGSGTQPGDAHGLATKPDEEVPDVLAALSIPAEPFDTDLSEPALDIPADFLNRNGNLELLSDQHLREADVPHPFSEEKSKELELANKYLEKMNKQVRKRWINPYKGGRLYRGIIKVELDVDGSLEDVYVYRSSGLESLDASVIEAIKSVPRFLVPENATIAARYYTRMSFHYSSIEAKTELLPFELELAKKEDS